VAHPNEVSVREGLAAFSRGDMDALRSRYFTEDIRWHVGGRSPLAGDYEGVAQILGLFGRVFELSGGTYRAETHDVLANDEQAVVLYTSRAERAGKQLEDNDVMVIHIRDGKWTETWGYSADVYAWDEFWS
jgi:ketosteroid isomerase-like protein